VEEKLHTSYSSPNIKKDESGRILACMDMRNVYKNL
jgi:hypothetical protein